MEDTHGISAEDWSKGIILSIIASIIGGASKLAIRKSWLMEEGEDQSEEDDSINSSSSRHHLPLELNSSRNDSPRRTDGNRIGISLDDRIQERNRRRCIALLLRYSGMVGMSVINPIFCVLAMKYASPSILAPFSGLTLVWVILFSGLVVGETPSMAQRTASFLIIIGEVIVAVFGDHRNEVDMKPSEVVSQKTILRLQKVQEDAQRILSSHKRCSLSFSFYTGGKLAGFLQGSISHFFFRGLGTLHGSIGLLD